MVDSLASFGGLQPALRGAGGNGTPFEWAALPWGNAPLSKRVRSHPYFRAFPLGDAYVYIYSPASYRNARSDGDS
ncbi:MAG TPA: hypothetical protein ENJ02_09410, partial [Chloroflexi bacterium]|nr:hypothetical protein [Chloroflexota bacterium]